MQNISGAILLLALTLAILAGCTDYPAGPQASTQAPETTVPGPLPEGTTATTASGGMALDLADLPDDYILRDRSVMITPDVTDLSRDLGWRSGYFVLFDRVGRIKTDQTRIRQSISIFQDGPLEKVYALEKRAFEGGDTLMASPYEIPFPRIGDNVAAYRMTDTPAEGEVTYTVIFTKNNVFERIIMAGTSTDYETLKEIVLKAEAKVP